MELKIFEIGLINRTLIYGFIMYTSAHPYITKVLRDDDFWNALDEISGENWPIFAIRPLTKGSYGFPNVPPGYVGFMKMEWKEPNENKKYFNDGEWVDFRITQKFELDGKKVSFNA